MRLEGRARNRPGFRSVLRGEFAALWVASTQSTLGDQLSRVALSVLVFDRTGSAFATAAVYALTFLPELLSSLLFGHLADRFPRRDLLVAGDLVRAVLVGLMALPGQPVWVLSILVVASVLVAAPWRAAENALVADIVDGEKYVLSVGLRTATAQAMQLVGFAAGGVVVAALGVRTGLAVDAVTFAVSAAVIRLFVHHRPSPTDRSAGQTPPHPFAGIASLLRNPATRTLLMYSWLLGLLVVPEGLAAPYAAQLGDGPRAVGLLLAAIPAGVLVGSLWYARLTSDTVRARLLAPLAVVAGLPLVFCALVPPLAVTIALWAVVGACTCYLIQVSAEYVRLVPSELRGRAMALASGGLVGSQGLGLLGGGALTTLVTPSSAIATTGAAAVFGAAIVTIAGTRGPSKLNANPSSAAAQCPPPPGLD